MSRLADQLSNAMLELMAMRDECYTVASAGDVRQLRLLRSRRMRATYKDLCQNPRYSAAVDFLVDDLFGVANLGDQAEQLRKGEQAMVRILPEYMLYVTIDALQLTTLMIKTDKELLAFLKDRRIDLLNLNLSQMSEAYRASVDKGECERQIVMVRRIGNDIDQIIKKPFISAALKMCRRPARAMGLGDLQDFLERGFAAFKHMQGADQFLAIYESREKVVIEEMYR